VPTLFSVLFVLVKHATKGFDFDSIQYAVNPIYRNHVNYAVFITMLFPFIFLAKSWYNEQTFKYKVLKYSVPVFLAAIYFSYTRGAWLAVGAMLTYYYVLRFRLTKYIIMLATLGAIGFCTYILHDNNYLRYSPDYQHTIYHDELADHLTSTFEMEDMSTVERFYRWIAAVKLFKEHPVVGVGPNNFVANYKQHTVTAFETYISDNEERSTVHNYFLLLLTEQGLPALLLFLLLIVVTLLKAQQLYSDASEHRKKFVLAVTLCIVVFLLNNTLSDLVEANKVGSLFLMCLGLLIGLSAHNIELEQA
jgi:O-antigen ligase